MSTDAQVPGTNTPARSGLHHLVFSAGLLGLICCSALYSGALNFLFMTSLPDQDRDWDGPTIVITHPENSAAVSTDNWPCLFGPLQNSTLNSSLMLSEAGPEKFEILWERELGTGYSSPVIAGGVVYVPDRREDQVFLTAILLDSGETLWEWSQPTDYVCPNPPHSSGPYSTPLVDGGFVYFLTAEGELICLDAQTGEKHYSRPLSQEYSVPENVFAVGHTPLVYRDWLILNLGGKPDAGLVALEKKTGELVWKSTNFGDSYATPMIATIHGREIGFALTAEQAVSFDPETGSVFWNFPMQAIADDFVNATSPVHYGDLVIFSAYQAGTYTLRILPDGQYEQLRHDRRLLVSQFNPLTCRNGYLFGWHFFDKSFRCIDLATGNLMWKCNTDIGRGTHLMFENVCLLAGESGQLALVDPDPAGFSIKLEPDLPLLKEPAFSAPAYDGGRFVWRNEERIICFGIAEADPD